MISNISINKNSRNWRKSFRRELKTFWPFSRWICKTFRITSTKKIHSIKETLGIVLFTKEFAEEFVVDFLKCKRKKFECFNTFYMAGRRLLLLLYVEQTKWDYKVVISPFSVREKNSWHLLRHARKCTEEKCIQFPPRVEKKTSIKTSNQITLTILLRSTIVLVIKLYGPTNCFPKKYLRFKDRNKIKFRRD